MRIIAGRFRGRNIETPPADQSEIRPTSDRVREGVASALQARNAFENASVLDLFAGTGAWSLEALSRGAQKTLLIDQGRKALKLIRQNVASLAVEASAHVMALDLFSAPAHVVSQIEKTQRGPFDLIFADPPYDRSDKVPPVIEALEERGLLNLNAWLVTEFSARHSPLLPKYLVSAGTYRYGDTHVMISTYSKDPV